MSFCQLHNHDQYSLLDGYGTAENYVSRALELGFTHLGLTNHANIDGLIKFQNACDKNGIVPIMGCEAYIVPDASRKEDKEKRGHVVLLIQNSQGFKNLCQMLTYANIQGFYKRPRIDYELLKKHTDGLVILTGCSSSFLINNDGLKLFHELCEITPNIYLEVMPHNMGLQTKINSICKGLSTKYKVKLVATNDCHYVLPTDYKVQEVLLAVQTKAKWSDSDRFKFSFTGLYLRSPDEMLSCFLQQKNLSRSEIRSSMANTMEIANLCSGFRIKKREVWLPTVPGYEGVDPGSFLWECVEKALLNWAKSEKWATERLNLYFERLRIEWKIINEKKFSPYFMVVWELVNWCKANDVMVGPGRGSVGGSLMAYLLGITAVDPIKYGLLFSRFIAEDRIDYPDIDIDFEDRKRHMVRDHLEFLYGKNSIASISTFQTMKGRAAIRDVARVFDIPLKDVDEFAKTIDDGADAVDDFSTIDSSSKEHWFGKKYPEEVALAIKLEGQIRGVGQHAAAVVISAEDLTQGTRGNLSIRSNEIVSNWDMADSEFMGLMKLDVLGLNTLSVLNETKRLIHMVNPEFSFDKIALDDLKVYKEIYDGNNSGVFQISARSTSKIAQQISATNINELSDVIALVRPGPMDSGMTQDYIDRKNKGLRWKRKHQIYEDIVKDTYGIVIYQEQVMDVIHKVAGLPYATADRIRKVIGKKRDPKEFEPYEKAFIAGCIESKTFSKQEAKEFWKALQAHARYSFNKSHSVEYAIIAYWTAWCKLYYPVEFICASLTYGQQGKHIELIEESVKKGFKLKLPKVGISDAFKWVCRDNVLYVPFIQIKGVGEKTAEECANFKGNSKGFFNIAPVKKGKIHSLLEEIGALDKPPTLQASELAAKFDFPIGTPESQHKAISAIVPCANQSNIKGVLDLSNIPRNFPNLLASATFPGHDNLKDCKECSLREQCKSPVPPSAGEFNIMIIGEAPGREEDEQKKGFVGKAGQMLWNELGKYDLFREDFHVTNVCKCYPAQIRTPKAEHIKACYKWLQKEMEFLNPRLILSLGNTSMFALIGKTGITELNATTVWYDKLNSWVCWGFHPSAVLHNPSNKKDFESGIKNFVAKVDIIGGLNNGAR
jgi:DNA polymerase-3 subunit alpha